MIAGGVVGLNENLKRIMQQTFSVHDLSREPEAFYHGLFLGLTASLDRTRYELKSNRESGLGFYDILIIPKDITQPGIILELKRVLSPKTKPDDDAMESLLEQKAKQALEQIENQQYTAEIKQRGITQVVKLGIAFCVKHFKLMSA